MNFKVMSVTKIAGAVDLPASKSYSIRAFFVAACGGRSRLVGASDCDDALVALSVAKAFGCTVTKKGAAHTIVTGGHKLANGGTLPVRESGTSLRFLLPLLPFHMQTALVSGKGTLVGRPNHHLCESLRSCGLAIRGTGAKESVPVSFSGGTLSGGRIPIDGSLSSQFVSALMIACPRCDKDTNLVMTGKTLVSREYIIMTQQILERAGIRIIKKSARTFLIPGKQTFRGLGTFVVPSDWGLAAFFMAAGALVPSKLTLKGYFDDTLVQSDGAILSFLKKMGVVFTRSSRALSIKGPCVLKGGVFSLKDCPDLVPIMAVTAMFAKGVTRLKDIGHARVKESDRISDLRQELLRVGADIEEKPDELIIRPCASYKGGVVLDPHHDHRLAMAFAVLGLRVGVTVKDMECTAKSYPCFVKSFSAVLSA